MSKFPREKGKRVYNGEKAQVTIPGQSQVISVAAGATETLVPLSTETTWVMLDVAGEVVMKRSDDTGVGFPLHAGGNYTWGLPTKASLEFTNSGPESVTITVLEAGA
jgi:hypothetical protein